MLQNIICPGCWLSIKDTYVHTHTNHHNKNYDYYRTSLASIVHLSSPSLFFSINKRSSYKNRRRNEWWSYRTNDLCDKLGFVMCLTTTKTYTHTHEARKNKEKNIKINDEEYKCEIHLSQWKLQIIKQLHFILHIWAM